MVEAKPLACVIIYGGKTGWIGGLMQKLIEKEYRKFDCQREVISECDRGTAGVNNRILATLRTDAGDSLEHDV